jgi:hypothetical protein
METPKGGISYSAIMAAGREAAMQLGDAPPVKSPMRTRTRAGNEVILSALGQLPSTATNKYH